MESDRKALRKIFLAVMAHGSIAKLVRKIPLWMEKEAKVRKTNLFYCSLGTQLKLPSSTI